MSREGPRVCLLLESFHPVVGGMEAQGRALADGLAARGVPVVVVTRREPPELPALEQLGAYEVQRVAPGSSRWSALPAVLRRLRALRRHYDLIYVSGLRAFGLPAVAAAAASRDTAVVLKADNAGELSGAFFEPALRRRGLTHRSRLVAPFNRARQAVLRRADHFVAISRAMREEFVGHGVPPERVSVIPNGVDLTRFRPAQPEGRARLRERLGLPERARIVVFAGRLVSWKGPLVLLEAWRRMLEDEGRSEDALRAPRPLLLFLGSGGADSHNCEREARAFAAAHGLDPGVRFLGDVANVADYLRCADAFALPTERDAFAMSVLEAMAAGLPVITTRVGGLADYVRDGENALAVEPGDAAAMHGALAALLRDPALRARLGNEAVGTARGFSQEVVVEAHLELFRGLARRT